MLVLDVVADDDIHALADGEIVEIAARIELDLVADDARRCPGREARRRR